MICFWWLHLLCVSEWETTTMTVCPIEGFERELSTHDRSLTFVGLIHCVTMERKGCNKRLFGDLFTMKQLLSTWHIHNISDDRSKNGKWLGCFVAWLFCGENIDLQLCLVKSCKKHSLTIFAPSSTMNTHLHALPLKTLIDWYNKKWWKPFVWRKKVVMGSCSKVSG